MGRLIFQELEPLHQLFTSFRRLGRPARRDVAERRHRLVEQARVVAVQAGVDNRAFFIRRQADGGTVDESAGRDAIN